MSKKSPMTKKPPLFGLSGHYGSSLMSNENPSPAMGLVTFWTFSLWTPFTDIHSAQYP